MSLDIKIASIKNKNKVIGNHNIFIKIPAN